MDEEFLPILRRTWSGVIGCMTTVGILWWIRGLRSSNTRARPMCRITWSRRHIGSHSLDTATFAVFGAEDRPRVGLFLRRLGGGRRDPRTSRLPHGRLVRRGPLHVGFGARLGRPRRHRTRAVCRVGTPRRYSRRPGRGGRGHGPSLQFSGSARAIRLVTRVRPEVVHCTHFPTPVPVRTPLVVTLHDLLPLVMPGPMPSKLKRGVYGAGTSGRPGSPTLSWCLAGHSRRPGAPPAESSGQDLSHP